MKLSILTTPKSISITDVDRNSISVIKTPTGLIYQSSLETPKKNKQMRLLAEQIKQVVINPKNERDNYKVRFNQLAKQLTSIHTHSYISLLNLLKKDTTVAE